MRQVTNDSGVLNDASDVLYRVRVARLGTWGQSGICAPRSRKNMRDQISHADDIFWEPIQFISVVRVVVD